MLLLVEGSKDDVRCCVVSTDGRNALPRLRGRDYAESKMPVFYDYRDNLVVPGTT